MVGANSWRGRKYGGYLKPEHREKSGGRTLLNLRESLLLSHVCEGENRHQQWILRGSIKKADHVAISRPL